MATLSIAELRKRNNFTIFRDRIKTNGKFTISEGNGQKIQITQKFAYEFNTLPVSYTHLTLPTNREV